MSVRIEESVPNCQLPAVSGGVPDILRAKNIAPLQRKIKNAYFHCRQIALQAMKVGV